MGKESKMRCWTCQFLDYDCLDESKRIRKDGTHFCGLHGMATVDPDGAQVSLDNRGGCGYARIHAGEQIELL